MNIEQLRETIEEAVQPDYRGRLLSRGQARAMIWRNGELPEGSPRFTENLSYELASYGLSLLSMAIRLREQGDEETLVPVALERAGDALEAVVSKGDPNDTTRGFYRLLAAAAFHLGGFSARAFSLLARSVDDSNLSEMERIFALLIVRSIRDLEDGITGFHADGFANEAELLAKYFTDANRELEDQEQSSGKIDAAISDVLEECFCSGLGIFLVALERGDSELVSDAIAELDKGLQTSAELNFVLQWWCFRVASEVVTDLWDSSFHEIIPLVLPDADNERWGRLRALYISSLYKRERAEIDLWPSQIDAAIRSIDTSDNLVVSLPTSAGKTRVAELCILRCLADGKRIVFVTPLRALSAQTEVGLQKTFGPLGISITALYGSIGTRAC